MVKGEVYRVPGDSQGVKEEAYRASRGKLTESPGVKGEAYRVTGGHGGRLLGRLLGSVGGGRESFELLTPN